MIHHLVEPVEYIDRLTEDEPEPLPCSHRSVYVEPPDPSVGIFGWVRFCEDCLTQLEEDE